MVKTTLLTLSSLLCDAMPEAGVALLRSAPAERMELSRLEPLP